MYVALRHVFEFGKYFLMIDKQMVNSESGKLQLFAET